MHMVEHQVLSDVITYQMDQLVKLVYSLTSYVGKQNKGMYIQV